MLVWSTQIPVSPSKNCEDLLSLCQQWISGSPHSKWKQEQFPEVKKDLINTAESHGQTISVARTATDEAEFCGFRHYWRDDENREWITEIAGYHSDVNFFVGIHLHCQTTGIGTRIPAAKKPYIVRQVLEVLGADIDGGFRLLTIRSYWQKATSI